MSRLASANSSLLDKPAGRPWPILVLRMAGPHNGPNCLSGLSAEDVREIVCDRPEQTLQLARAERPISALVHYGRRITEPARQATVKLAEAAPWLRLVALVEADAAASPELAELVRKGLVYDFHTLPLDRERLLGSLGHIAGLVALEAQVDGPDPGTAWASGGEVHIVGSSPPIVRVFNLIRKFAEVDAPILVTGETGTGKELAAKAIHDRSAFAKGPFVSINCAGLPASIIESELFGYERGAFTGAVKQKVGRIEAARGGTLFLDEIGDLPPEIQGHLLRFLQEKTIERLGSTGTVTVDCRVIAATNVNLEQAVKAGRFREDLFYRLNVLALEMPPLRERGDDIMLLATYFLRKFSSELQIPKLGFHDGAIEKLQRYRWPGNVREMISTIRRAVVMADGRCLKSADLSFVESHSNERLSLPDLATARRQLEERLMREALRMNASNIKRAAQELGVSRVTFYRMMEKYAIRPLGEGGLERRVGLVAPHAGAYLAKPPDDGEA
jgi:DNA-binding NtrC family response regulator